MKHPDLIYDVGLHKGEDSEFYLQKGYRVVAFEADPDLAQACREKFASELETGRMVIIEGAIVDRESSAWPIVTFYRNTERTILGTTIADWAERNERLGSPSTAVSVPAVDFREALRAHGIPYYLKIDIEGADMACLRALSWFDERPDFVSIESSKTVLCEVSADLSLLQSLGYTQFAIVQQSAIEHQTEPDPPREGIRVGHRFQRGASGMFGREVPAAWHGASAAMALYRLIFVSYSLFGDRSIERNRLLKKVLRRLERAIGRRLPGWCDPHADVADLCQAQFAALDKLRRGAGFSVYNLGSGVGHSVAAVVTACRSMLPGTPRRTIHPRRPGDPARLIADGGRARLELAFAPAHRPQDMIDSAVRWHLGYARLVPQ